MQMLVDRLCRQNQAEAVAVLLRTGLTDSCIHQLLSTPEWVVPQSWVRKMRQYLIEEGELEKGPRRSRRAPSRILYSRQAIRTYSIATATYLQLTANRTRVDPAALINAHMAHRALAAAQVGSADQIQIDINDLLSVLDGLLEGEVYYRHCSHCSTWSLLALSSRQAMVHCPFCRSNRIESGEVWFSDAAEL